MASSNKMQGYKALITKMLENKISEIASDEIIIECNNNDFELVKNVVANFHNNNKVRLRLSDKPINVIGGIRLRSADGSITYDNTLDSRIERLKPLIRKNIAQMLRGEI